MAKGMDIRYGHREVYEIGWDIEVESLILYNYDTSGFEESWIDPHLWRCMSAQLKKLQFLNNVIFSPEDNEYDSWRYTPQQIPAVYRSKLGHGYDWLPIQIADDITDMEALEEVILPEGLTELSSNAFSFCDSLKKVVFPASLKKIGLGAFRSCAKLKTIWMCQGAAPAIGSGAFFGCNSLRSITFYENILGSLDKNETYSEDILPFSENTTVALTGEQITILEYWDKLDTVQKHEVLDFIISKIQE